MKFSIGSVIIDVVYAIDIEPENDPIIDTIHTALGELSYALVPVKNIPDWLPGIPFKDFSKKYTQATKAAADIPFDIVKSYTALLQAIVASIRYPETQKKMHEELDRVLGDRLSTLADRKDLPYVSAFCSEVLSWRPAAPLGIPHAALEDDAYGDYFIPKEREYCEKADTVLTLNILTLEDSFSSEFLWRLNNSDLEEGWSLVQHHFNEINEKIADSLVFHITPKKDENGNDLPVLDRTIDSALL
ncbi:hypothetical protein Clacol_007780 [Clathrus columnatus]|uniref:Uncharacterized protein n=1 Tax=Clathrus columnatus TaxID=1419009 RepID=A0AAV5AKQ8_9AGAM|nr:hypothetical protein Clacol_007780 [Clathrus columnatus]